VGVAKEKKGTVTERNVWVREEEENKTSLIPQPHRTQELND